MINAMEVVATRNSLLTDDERRQILAPATSAFQSLREGVATFEQWDDLHSLVLLALTIEAQGVVRGLREHFTAAERAMEAIYKRVNDGAGGATWGRATALYFDEIRVLQDALELHAYQLSHLSLGELRAATGALVRRLQAAGGQVLPGAPAAVPRQERLL